MKKKQIVGIINCTPDSYFERGRFMDSGQAIDYGLQLIEEGADILDIGGESTRPNSIPLSASEELDRVLPVIKGLRQKTNHLLSIDTFKPEVAEAALDAGADWVNDITGLSDVRMQKLVCKHKATCCIMHLYGPPHSSPTPNYPQGVVKEILDFFNRRVEELLKAGIEPSKIILDPGIGGGAFGKTPDECLQILKHIKDFAHLGYPILIGLSRKSFLQKILQKPASELLSTTLVLNTIALLEGASYIRLHDVAEQAYILMVLEKLEAVN